MRPADSREPRFRLLRAQIKGGHRILDNISIHFTGEEKHNATDIEIQTWTPATGVFRYTVDERLEPGEYAFVEMTDEGQAATSGISASMRPERIPTNIGVRGARRRSFHRRPHEISIPRASACEVLSQGYRAVPQPLVQRSDRFVVMVSFWIAEQREGAIR